MTLKQKFDNVEIMFEGQLGQVGYDELCEASNQCITIADQLAIEFGQWVDDLVIGDFNLYNENSIEQLLQIYKKEKGL